MRLRRGEEIAASGLAAHDHVLDASGQLAVALGGLQGVELRVANHPGALLDWHLFQHGRHVVGARNVDFLEVGRASHKSGEAERGLQVCAHEHWVGVLSGALQLLPNFFGVLHELTAGELCFLSILEVDEGDIICIICWDLVRRVLGRRIDS